MSRPVRTALEKTFHISLHPSSGENNMDQSMPFRNLPIDALELARRSRLVMVFLVLLMRFPCSGVATTTLWSDNPSGAKGCGGGGGIVIMHICQYKIKCSVLPGMLFHDLFEAKVPQQATDIQTIEIAGY